MLNDDDITQAKEKVIQILINESKRLVKDVTEESRKKYAPDTTSKYSDLDIYIGNRDYYNKIRKVLEEKGREDYLDYESYMRILLSHYLTQRLEGTGLNQYQDAEYYPAPIPGTVALVHDNYNINWLESSGNTTYGDSTPESVWITFFPDSEIEQIKDTISKKLSRTLSKELRNALIEFPEKFNQHNIDLEDTGSDQFYSTVNHELTHVIISRKTAINPKPERDEFIQAADEAVSQFTGLYILTERKFGEENALDFENKIERYSSYNSPSEIKFIVDVLRQYFWIEKKDKTNLKVVDKARKKFLEFMWKEENTKLQFFKTFTPEIYRHHIIEFEKECSELNPYLEGLSKELQRLVSGEATSNNFAVDGNESGMRIVKPEGNAWEKIIKQSLEDLSQIKSSKTISQEILENGYKKLTTHNSRAQKGFSYLGEVIEAELKAEIKAFLNLKSELIKLKSLVEENDLEEQIFNLERVIEEIDKVESDLENILKDLENKTKD